MIKPLFNVVGDVEGSQSSTTSSTDQFIKNILMSPSPPKNQEDIKTQQSASKTNTSILDAQAKNPLLESTESNPLLEESMELHLEAPDTSHENQSPVKDETNLSSISHTGPGGNDILCTPVKMTPREKPGHYMSPFYQASPPIVNVTPPANTPTKAAVEIMAAIAQVITTPAKGAKSPHKSPARGDPAPVTLLIRSPTPKKNLAGFLSSSPRRSMLFGSPTASTRALFGSPGISQLTRSPIRLIPPSLLASPDTPKGSRISEDSPTSSVSTVGTPTKESSVSPETSTMCQNSKTPEGRFRTILPAPVNANTSPTKPMSPLSIKSKKKSPRRKILQQKARAIRPKGFVISTYVSPVKKAAENIKARAKLHASPVKGAHLITSPVKGAKGAHVRKILPKGPITRPSMSSADIASGLPGQRSPRKRTRSKAAPRQRRILPKKAASVVVMPEADMSAAPDTGYRSDMEEDQVRLLMYLFFIVSPSHLFSVQGTVDLWSYILPIDRYSHML